MVNTLTGLLVGMHFRPPAKLILECLPSGTPLTLRHEPDNPYDEDAVAVEVQLRHIAPSQKARLESDLPAMGWSWEMVEEHVALARPLQLGYIGAGKNKEVKALESEGVTHNRVFIDAQAIVPWTQCVITLGFSAGGKPLVVMRAPAEPAQPKHEHPMFQGSDHAIPLSPPAEDNWGDS